MEKYTLIGGKLGHSLSPQIHDILFRLRGREAAYSLTELTEDGLSVHFGELKELAGFNVTIPHKMRVMHLTAQLGFTALSTVSPTRAAGSSATTPTATVFLNPLTLWAQSSPERCCS